MVDQRGGRVEQIDRREKGVRQRDTFVIAIARSRPSATSVMLLAHLSSLSMSLKCLSRNKSLNRDCMSEGCTNYPKDFCIIASRQ